MSKKKVVILFGGVSAEHEVSVITGLQVAEKIDRNKYEPLVIYATPERLFKFYPEFNNKKDFQKINPKVVFFGRDKNGAFIQQQGYFGSKIYFDCAYLAFHGGEGESGPMQGFLQSLGVPITGPDAESSVVTMNKSLTRLVLSAAGLPVMPGVSVTSWECKQDEEAAVNRILKALKLPVIIKPSHLGSSIGIKIAKTEVELKKYLAEASFVDNEITVEKLLTDFTEYNCSVRRLHGKMETSPIERPVSKDEILSFADKYQRGGGKKGNSGGGMADLARELPAKISKSLESKLQEMAKQVFMVCKCDGVIRVDFMVTKDEQIFITEPNPIPGSMSFYLWEAGGVSFTQQISDLVEESFVSYKERESRRLKYETDIVEKFISGQGGGKS
jgi:D-alanine-D-alanine ligase